MNKIYNWKRFWCIRGGRIDLSDRGFLSDSESEYSHFHPQDVKSFEEIVNIPCLVLLGEPGIGKSNELEKASATSKNLLDLTDNEIYYDELNQYSNESRFIQNVFKNSNFLEAQKNNSPFILFLDSLDECKIRIDTISEILANELKNNYWTKLYFRITCRTAEWSSYLEGTLKKIYSEQNIGFYELAPLRQKDVTLTLKENNIDEQKFFDEIYRKGVQPLTIKPITLSFITNLFIKNKNLPPSRKEIYEEGLKLLIDEPSHIRRESKLSKKYSNSHKLIAAQRIASVMMLCNKSSICLRNNIAESLVETDVLIEEVCGREKISNEEIEISEDLIKETLNTGLFVLHNTDRLGWFHQTFAEYLAARYFYVKGISDEQLFNLLFQNDNEKLKSIPQLNETIGWIVTFRPNLFKQIIGNDLEVLLNSDVTLQDDKSKEELIAQLLKLFEEKKIFDFNYTFKNNYHKLNHFNIENQLKITINDKSKSDLVRYEAIDIAESCAVDSLLEDIFKIFIDKTESLSIRNNAGWALKNIGNEDYIKKMEIVLFGDLSEDVDDELKGICLLALWPKFMSYQELFSVLSKRKNPNLGGNYSMFLYDFHILNPNDEDLITALQWVSKQETKHNIDLHGISDIMNKIMFVAFNYIDHDTILDHYKTAVIHFINNHDDIVTGKLADKFYTFYETDDFKRRRLTKAIFNSMSDPLKQIESFYFPSNPLAFKKDFQWILEQANLETEENKKRAWIILARYYFDNLNTENINALVAFSEKDTIIYEEFKYYLKTIELDSEEAQKEKERYSKYNRPGKWEEKRNLCVLRYKEDKIKLLNKLKGGEIKILWQLIWLLGTDPEKYGHANHDHSDILEYPGWEILNEDEKKLFISCSKEYLIDQDPHNHEWFCTYTRYHPARAGYKIIRILMTLDFEFINNLSVDILKKWAPIIISSTESYMNGEDDYPKKIIQFFYQKIPNEILVLFKQRLEFETKKDEFAWITKKFENCWDDNINRILFEKLIEDELFPNCFQSIFTDLLDKNYKPAIEFLLKKLVAPLPANKVEYQKIIIGSKLLLNSCFKEAWPPIWLLMNKNESFGKELFLNIVYNRINKKNFLKDMTESELSDLFMWLEEKFPDEEFKESEEFHYIGPREEVKYFKNDIITELEHRGNNEAVQSIEKMKLKLPKLDWLNYVLYRAKIVTRQKKWIPLKPNELITLFENINLRYVRDENDLINIIFESLNRLEVEMHRTPPIVKQIWNSKPAQVKPKEEGDLSDFIKAHLQRDLTKTIVNREVEIKPTLGKSRGENIDLLVQAFSKNNDIISVIIEVKGSWNKNLKIDMENQLKKRYLNNNQYKHGIYLVGWFLCDSWEKSDYRRNKNPKLEIEQVKKLFGDQTKSLTKDGDYLYSHILDCRLK